MEPFDLLGQPDVPRALQHGEGWEAFRDLAFIGQMTLVLVIAMTLSAAIAYHPSTRRKARTLAELEQPKTFIMYSIVGALIALIVKVQPSMALVVFGIGGLLRFRTFVGAAKDTGRVILVTVLGLCCGLQLYVIAVLGTAFGWLLILALERRAVGRLVVQGLEREHIARAAAEHARILEQAGCMILGEERNVLKGITAFVYRASEQLDRPRLEAQFEALPDHQRGAIQWESA
ncbi:MAG: hypothetical protein AAGF11_43155 [Myxococcota bacterium]